MSSNKKLTDFKVLTFDCYGTLVDWTGGLIPALQPLIDRSGKSQDEIFERLNKTEADIFFTNPTMPYDQVLVKTYDTIAQEFGIPSSFAISSQPDHKDHDASIAQGRADIHKTENWSGFPDSVDALNTLQKRHGYKLVVLSNITKEMFSKTMKYALKGVQFDAVYTAEEIGSYKPDRKNFEYLLRKVQKEFGFQKEDVLHVAHGLSSNHAPAKEMEFASCWIRRGEKDVPEELKDRVAFGWSFDDMKEFVEAVEKEKE